MYRTNASGTITRIADGVVIPSDVRNADYREYLSWMSSGNTSLPADNPPERGTPSLSRFQAKAVLLKHGMLAAVEAYATSPFADPLVKLAWYEATEVKRNSLMVMNIAILLDLNQSQLDNLFAEALTIEV